ncbi:MAG: hypothetical protein UR99_C0006G0021 [Candidatus Moranbacteria bacterium GW2011_GWD2_36_12]|nr:MAG: hypothetical protein UR99_C0006G0021 [Candidatus Moranbacteria bacterium GW2011_GWD2_36_12]KKQ07147.1 MAG: hypothetical protein US16_C0002G0021 [Candidatus Moranbacteria bacterium GW2011_GWE2_36_40]
MIQKISRNFLSSFLLAAILLVASGFSDGTIALASNRQDVSSSRSGSAAMNSMDNNITLDQTMHAVTGAVMIMHQDETSDNNALKPCCEDKQGGASAIQSSAFNQNIKFFPLGTETIIDPNYIFQYKLIELSSASPPKPDIISSVLLKE